MGYVVSLENADFSIPKEHWDAAFEAVCELNEHDELKSGGGQGEKWFSWMLPDYPRVAREEYLTRKRPHPLMVVFEELGFDWLVEDERGFCLTYYDNKSGDEDEFLLAVAPFVRPGSVLDWLGEDGAMWRQEFDGKTITTKTGRVVFD